MLRTSIPFSPPSGWSTLSSSSTAASQTTKWWSHRCVVSMTRNLRIWRSANSRRLTIYAGMRKSLRKPMMNSSERLWICALASMLKSSYASSYRKKSWPTSKTKRKRLNFVLSLNQSWTHYTPYIVTCRQGMSAHSMTFTSFNWPKKPWK